MVCTAQPSLHLQDRFACVDSKMTGEIHHGTPPTATEIKRDMFSHQTGLDWINIPMTDPWCCYINGNMDPINIPPMLLAYIPAPWILYGIYQVIGKPYCQVSPGDSEESETEAWPNGVWLDGAKVNPERGNFHGSSSVKTWIASDLTGIYSWFCLKMDENRGYIPQTGIFWWRWWSTIMQPRWNFGSLLFATRWT